jgi:hypothetical protein
LLAGDSTARSRRFASLRETVEQQRGRLARAESVLGALHAALLYAEDDRNSHVDFADMAAVARELVRESVHRLDSVYVRPVLEALMEGVRAPRAGRQSTAQQ